MKSSSKPSDSGAMKARCALHDGCRLNATAIAVLAELRRLIPGSALSGVVTNNEIAKGVGRSVRCVQLAMGSLVAARLIRRDKINETAEISTFKTVFLDLPRVNQIVAGSRKLKKIKKRTRGQCAAAKQTRSYEERYPFACLSDPSRFQPLDVSNALIEGRAYWVWISKALSLSGDKSKLEFVAQKRRKSDGERGGIVPNVHRREFVGAGSLPNLDKFAKYLESKQLEGTFRVKQESHSLLLVDDVAEAELDRLPNAAAILETSPGNFQATLVAPRSLSCDEVLAVQTALIEIVKGDVGANGSSQLRRFPGSINNKASLEHAFVTRVHHIPESLVLPTAEFEELLRLGTEMRSYRPSNRVGPAPDVHKIEMTAAPSNMHASSQNGETDATASGQDFGRAIELLCKGASDKQIVGEIAHRAGLRRKYGRGAGDKLHIWYAEKTLMNARNRFKPSTRRNAPQ